MASEDEIRGDPQNPVVAMQRELHDVLDRYADVRRAQPAWVATLLVDLADSYRVVDELDHEVEHLGEDVFVVHFGDMAAFVGAPRSGDYMDVDADDLGELLDEDVTDGGMYGERFDLADVQEGDDAE